MTIICELIQNNIKYKNSSTDNNKFVISGLTFGLNLGMNPLYRLFVHYEMIRDGFGFGWAPQIQFLGTRTSTPN